MNTVIVRYKVKADQAEKNIGYINAVFEALEQTSPDGIRYASFVAEDGVSFTHIASIERDDGSNPLPQLPEFQSFIADIGERCVEPPTPTACTVIGNFRVFE
jgi:hypothetical protein